MTDKDQDIKINQDPVSAVARKEKEMTAQDLERARDGNDLGEKFGRQNISSTTAGKVALENKKKEDEKLDNAIRQLLRQMREELARRIEKLDEHIAEVNSRIEELREELETTEDLLEKQFGRDWQEKLKRGELDPNDPLLRQWLMQRQQLKDYVERREKLIKERDELEKQIAEIEHSDLPDELKLERMKEVLEQGTAPGVQEVWRNNTAPTQAREIAGVVNTDNGQAIESLDSGKMFALAAGVSFAGKANLGKGIESRVGSLRSEFAEVADPKVPERRELVAVEIPVIKGPKLPG